MTNKRALIKHIVRTNFKKAKTLAVSSVYSKTNMKNSLEKMAFNFKSPVRIVSLADF